MHAGKRNIQECGSAGEANRAHQFMLSNVHIAKHGGEVDSSRAIHIREGYTDLYAGLWNGATSLFSPVLTQQPFRLKTHFCPPCPCTSPPPTGNTCPPPSSVHRRPTPN